MLLGMFQDGMKDVNKWLNTKSENELEFVICISMNLNTFPVFVSIFKI